MIKDFLKYPMGWTSFDLQLFAEGDDNGSGGTGGSGDDGQKFEEFTDPETGNKVKIPAEFKTLLGHAIAKTRKDTEGKYKPMLEKFESEQADFVAIRAEYEKLKEANMTAEERANENARKKILEHETTAKKATEEAATWKGRFEQSMIKNDIMSSFGDTKLFNPGQVADILKMEGKAFISEIVDETGKPIGEFETRVRLQLEDKDGNPEFVEGTPTQLFKRWIELDRNAHHLLNSIPAGNGTNRSFNNTGGLSKSDFEKLPPTKRMQMERARGK